jgi:hypothetical protein
MPNLDLTDDEHAALVRLVKHALDTDRFPMSPRLYPLWATPREAGAAATPRAPVTTQGLRTAEGQRSPEMSTRLGTARIV